MPVIPQPDEEMAAIMIVVPLRDSQCDSSHFEHIGSSSYHFGGSAAPACAEAKEAALATTAKMENFMITMLIVVELGKQRLEDRP